MMKDMRSFDRRALVRAAVTLVLALCLCLSVLPAVPVSADTQEDALGKLVGWGVMTGYPDGKLHPERDITRAEFVALVNRAYGYHETGNMPFLDVPYTAWYYDDISIAYNARYFDGTSSTTASPQANLSREQAMTLLARGMRLDSIPGEVTEFTDGRSFSTWSRGYVKAAYRKGLIGGYYDGSFRPLRNITRGEMATLLTRALGTLVHEKGEHTLGSVYGNVTINTPGTTLYDTTIMGDLYITGGLGLGSVELDNVRVLGSIIVAGGGESEAGQDSVVLRNVRADELKIDSLTGQYLSLRAEGSTVVTQTNVRTDCYIQDRTQAGQGLLGITLEGENGKYTLSGNLENVVNKAPRSSLKISRGTLGILTIDETAVGSSLTIESDATVKEVNLDTAVSVTGGGDVGSLNVNAEGSSTSMLPDDIYIRPGITANVYGETMDTELGQEASSAPRILAGYPKATDVAPTTLTATVATNKSGTLYWAVSSITDGSVGEEGLLSPAAYGSKAVKYGTLQVGKSNTDINISATGLTIGGNYYFSAMLVDARNDRSPVKVISFSTPDNTVPAFASGYPALSLNSYHTKKDYEDNPALGTYSDTTKYFTQFLVKSTKTCKLYWAVYSKGSTAPTAAEFRSGALAGSVAHDVQDAVRNSDTEVTVERLKELTDYDIYFWLCDADGTKSSAVRKLTFKTTDGTPPIFVTPPTQNSQPKATSLSLTTTVNENATVYWVAVPAGAAYPLSKGQASTVAMSDLEYAIFQIEHGLLGSVGLKSGKVSVRAGVEATINISGLTAETAYDVWYVAVDAAGNYSLFNTNDNVAGDTSISPSYARVYTLDTTAPTVTQEFTKTDDSPVPRPYPDSTISLFFSEDVQRWSYINDKDGNNYSLLSARGDEDKIKDFLLSEKDGKKVLTLYYLVDNKWVEFPGLEDGRFSVRLDSDGRRVVVDINGLELNSGTWYQFEINDLADTSNAQNKMREPYKLEQFQTISSQVVLSDYGDLTVEGIKYDDVTVNKPSGYKSGDSIRIDVAFEMRPEATSREDSARQWDMLIWANTAVKFELYRCYVPSANEPAVAAEATPGDAEATPGDTEPAPGDFDRRDNAYPNEWVYLGTGSFNHNTSEINSGTFIGLTMFQNLSFYNGTVSHPLNQLMDNGAVYRYGIHVVSVEGSSEYESWSKNVTFQINVVAGSSLLNDLTRGAINETRYQAATSGDDAPVEDITRAPRQKLPFQLNVPFEDRRAPEFVSEFPIFERSDTSLDMTVQLTRPGTIYWVVTPVYSTIRANETNLAISPTVADDFVDANGNYNEINNIANIDNMTWKYPYSESTAIRDIIKDAIEDSDETIIDLKESDPTKLGLPTNDTIYRPGNLSSNSRIKVGSQPVSAISTITIEDLTPSTGYFIYLVVQGEGSYSYSDNVMLYKVATTPPERPVITLTYDNVTTVNVRTADKDDHDMDTHANYMIVRNTDKALTDPQITGDYAPKGLSTTLQECYQALNMDVASLPNEYRNITLLTALTRAVTDRSNYDYPVGSVFDLYAPQEVKTDLAAFIAGTTSSVADYIAGGTSMEIPLIIGSGRNQQVLYDVPVNCEQYLSPGAEYIFLASAVNTQGSDTGFRAIQPVSKKDGDSPAIWNIAAELTASRTSSTSNNYTLNGSITLFFDKDLYYLDPSRKIQMVDLASSAATRDENSTSVENIITNKASTISLVTNDANVGSATDLINLQLNGTGSGATITPSRSICNASGTVNDGNRLITINAKPSTQEGYLTVTITSTDWKNANQPFTFEVPIAGDEDVTGVSLSQTSLILYKVPDTSYSTAKITATATPASANSNEGDFAWINSDPTVATLDAITGRTVTVTAASVGQTTITVTVGSRTAICTVTVLDPSIALSEQSFTITKDEEHTLTATVTPSGFNTTVSWNSSDPSVASVPNGKVRGLKGGTTTITAEITVEGKKISSTPCEVTVIEPEVQLPEVENLVLRGTTGTATLTLKPVGFDASMITSVVWESDNKANVNVSNVESDKLSATLSVGTEGPGAVGRKANITAKVTLKNGTTITSTKCLVTVQAS